MPKIADAELAAELPSPTHPEAVAATPDLKRDPRQAPKAPASFAAAAALFTASNPLQAQTPYVPSGTGSPGPGLPNTNLPADYNLTGVLGDETFDSFGCKVWKASPATPDWQQASVYFERKFYEKNDFQLPNGGRIAIWGFEDTLKSKGQNIYPSPIIRVSEGDMVHVKLDQKKGTHTIHHHGIEPTTMNDGVGHVSFEVEDTYIYQWQPRHAGTWFYHCHKNTPVHFEYGMFGLLVVDPPKIRVNGYDRVPAFKGGPIYDVEAFWVADDMDPRWHTLQQEAGLCGEDDGLNIFRPQYFFISGIANTQTMTSTKVAVTSRLGDKILIRLLNASYGVLAVTFEKLDVEVISVDGHSLGGPEKPWSRPFTIPKGQTIHLASASRYDLLIDTAQLGATLAANLVDTVRFEFQDWVTRKVHNATSSNAWQRGLASTTITVRRPA